ncbi:hypothetical protein [Streptomyces sp. NPDC097610]|uniref:hypothetical protein n=1 Tax=Streptomyces sp. NPDC097610 TaxID=3157227 RepID=UPI0033312077
MTAPAERLFRLFPSEHPALAGHPEAERQEAAIAAPGLVRDEPAWMSNSRFRANGHAAENARSYTRMHLTLANVCVDIEDAAVVGGVLMANAVAHSGVPEYAQIPMQWVLLQTSELLIQVQDPRCDFPDFDQAVTWKPAEGEKPRGLWIARELGAELAFAPTEAGKIVQALIKPLKAPAWDFPSSRPTP